MAAAADSEKRAVIIREFERFVQGYNPGYTDYNAEVLQGVLALLKVQEPVEPVREYGLKDTARPDNEYTGFPPVLTYCATWTIYKCGNCGDFVGQGENFCPNCGRAVKWE